MAPLSGGLPSRAWWPVARRVLTLGLIAGVLVLVLRHARTVDWAAVGQAVQA